MSVWSSVSDYIDEPPNAPEIDVATAAGFGYDLIRLIVAQTKRADINFDYDAAFLDVGTARRLIAMLEEAVGRIEAR